MMIAALLSCSPRYPAALRGRLEMSAVTAAAPSSQMMASSFCASSPMPGMIAMRAATAARATTSATMVRRTGVEEMAETAAITRRTVLAAA